LCSASFDEACADEFIKNCCHEKAFHFGGAMLYTEWLGITSRKIFLLISNEFETVLQSVTVEK